ncbi:hypothetical protein [Cupriavidus oxalaticus]|uniref:Uncharacterized protein n=1 Tax=Cupriavidus oxalaticus TaxID=96344 RepID=A0A4P7LUI8_9BURK|nr:hypothetical protein [Cupriavidus oxalaticus]QBY56131.1 hypothetical protein E0W60_34295 [Cupriavidus oxalaticus]
MSARRESPAFSSNSIHARIGSEAALRLAATSPEGKTFSVRRDTADDLRVDRLATAMKRRLSKQSRRLDLDNPLEYSVEKLAQMLAEATCSGDPISVAIIAMALHARHASHLAVADHARRALLRGSRELLAINAARYEKLRNVPADQLGTAGVPCISLPMSANAGTHLTGTDADAAVDAFIPRP